MLRWSGRLVLICVGAFVGGVALANTWAELDHRRWERRRIEEREPTR